MRDKILITSSYVFVLLFFLYCFLFILFIITLFVRLFFRVGILLTVLGSRS
jgi:hypothetical protein